ncbi:MAG: efflux RND transporter permease subunit [Rikenellaceae bacterium]|nr:efflux RND transporter permease subunit [Rikenellaceae bacterium]
MSLTSYSLNRPKVVWFFMAVMLIGGVVAFTRLGKKEDSPFVIKSAVLTVRMPGASPLEVEQLLTEPIESELQKIAELDNVRSTSHFGYARIVVELRDDTPKRRIPQLWDEVRRKALDVQSVLPAEASTIEINDDFGDVYGIYYGISAEEGISYEELRSAAQMVRRAVITLPGVADVTLFGEQQPVVEIRVSRARLASFSVRPESIIEAVRASNVVADAGEMSAGEMRVRIVEPTAYATLEDIGSQLLMSSDGRQVALSDIATIEMRYEEPPTSLMRVNGLRAMGIGVATEQRSDVVRTGELVAEELARLAPFIPLGIELTELYPEDSIAREANNRFLWNLLESVAIVVLVVMLAIGFRSGVTIGTSLLLAIGGTLLLMGPLGEGLNRTSLAGFIIAMGMLVDNAIVVTDNARGLMRRGLSRTQASVDGATSTRWPLLGATAIAIISFLPLYMADSSASEVVRPLFVVLSLSLALSWVLSLSQVPLMNSRMLMADVARSSRMSRLDVAIRWCVTHKWLTVVCAYVLFTLSLVLLQWLPKDFFPNLDKPYFRADVRLPDGYDIAQTDSVVMQLDEWLRRQPETKCVSAALGATPPRYYLASGAVAGSAGFANLLVETYSSRQARNLKNRFAEYARDSLPRVWVNASLFKLSPAPEAAIEFGFVGPDIDTLARLTDQALAIMRRDGRCQNIRNGWGNKIPVWRPVYSQARGTRLGISRADVIRYMTIATNGYQLGRFREGDRYIPILLRDEASTNNSLANLRSMPIFSRSGKVYPLEQTVARFDLGYEFGSIHRYNRNRLMKACCDPAEGVGTVALFESLQRQIESEVVLPPGYRLQIFGEQEGQTESNAALASEVPLAVVLMFVVLLLLFGDYRRPIVVLLTVPLVVVGMVLGLAITGKPFDFFSLLALLGLVGMNIKNAVVLVDMAGRNADFESLVTATRNRALPVALASGTTVLGMLPLAFDAMFGSMAVAIMGGLIVATALTIFVLPAIYAILLKTKKQ